MKFGIGAPARRKEDPAFLTGRGRYLADTAPEDAAFAHVLRSPVAHGRFTLSGLDAVRAMPGVLAVLTAEDCRHLKPLPCIGLAMSDSAGGRMPKAPAHPVLADGMVRYVGEPIAFLVAETAAAARDAAEAMEIDFEEEDAVADMAAAMAEGAPAVWPDFPGNIAFDWRIGDAPAVEEAFRSAERIVSAEIANNRLIANYMEPRGALGEYDATSGRYTLTCGSQGAHTIRRLLGGMVMGLPEERLRVVTPDVGGGFGTKLMIYGEYALVLLAAERVGRPVLWLADRADHFLADYHGRSHVSRAELALDGRGRFLALRVDTLAEMGAYFSQMGPFIPTNGAYMLAGTYRFPLADIRVRGIYTNTVPLDAYRGAGRPEAAYLIERLVDKAAREAGIAPDVIRRRNFIPPSAMPFRTATGRVYDTGEFDGHMRLAMERADWAGFRARVRHSRKVGRLRGIGMAVYIEACAGGGPETASVTLGEDGGVTVLIGSQTTGQGHVTAYAQIVAEHLGLHIDRVTVLQGDTALIATGAGTGGSRSIPVGGVALDAASTGLAEKIRMAAADMLEAAPQDLELDGGEVRIAGTDRAVDLSEVATKAGGLSFSEAWTPSAPTYPNGTHICEVEIDPETGGIEILRYTVVDDFGVTLNPLLLAGQIHGGIAQGVGQALMERTVHDPDTAQLLTASFQDYAIPRAADLPEFGFETRNVPSATNALGMKGAGEAGTIGAAPAVVNAVVDALHRHDRPTTHIDMPVTPERLWAALQGN